MPKRLMERACFAASALCLTIFAALHVHPRLAAAQAAASFPGSAESPRAALELDALPAPDQTLWSPQRIERYAADAADGDESEAIGVLRIPELDIHAPIYPGTGETVLNAGIGHVPETAALHQAGNIALAAHRDGFFRGLKDAAVGQHIELQTREGVRHFQIADFEIVPPTDTSVLAPAETSRLTLITCFPFYFVGNAPERFVVYALERHRL